MANFSTEYHRLHLWVRTCQHQADLFVSIHADGFTNPDAVGASVFALSNRGTSSAMAPYLSKRENAADDVGGGKYQQQDDYLQ